MSLNNTLCLSSPAGHGDPEHRRVERENGGRAGEGGDGDGGRNDHGHLGHGAVQIHRRGRGQGQSVHTRTAGAGLSLFNCVFTVKRVRELLPSDRPIHLRAYIQPSLETIHISSP